MLHVQSFTFNPVQENTYIVYNETKQCCIIDPGCYFAAEEKALTDFIANNELQPTLLLNTHCHLDHIFGQPLYSQNLWPRNCTCIRWKSMCWLLDLHPGSAGSCLLTTMTVLCILSIPEKQ
jgi:hypothetical protein